MNGRKVLISVMLHVVHHDLSDGPSPASVWVTIDGKKVLDGGSYPDEAGDSLCLARGLSLDTAESLQSTLVLVLDKLQIEAESELISDD